MTYILKYSLITTIRVHASLYCKYILTVHSIRWYLISNITIWEVLAAKATSSHPSLLAGRYRKRLGANTIDILVMSILVISLFIWIFSQNINRRCIIERLYMYYVCVWTVYYCVCMCGQCTTACVWTVYYCVCVWINV